MEYPTTPRVGALLINKLTEEFFDCHLVTCGHCGHIFNERTAMHDEDGCVHCPKCPLVDNTSSFPDLFY